MVPHFNERFMSSRESTCWTMIRAAAAGSSTHREELARRYLGVVRAYALARQEFRAALLEAVAFHQPGTPVELEEEAASLLKALS